jgi:high-affinity Fe2+/Pb2+ permease
MKNRYIAVAAIYVAFFLLIGLACFFSKSGQPLIFLLLGFFLPDLDK